MGFALFAEYIRDSFTSLFVYIGIFNNLTHLALFPMQAEANMADDKKTRLCSVNDTAESAFSNTVNCL